MAQSSQPTPEVEQDKSHDDFRTADQKKLSWVTSAMAEKMGREYFLVVSAREMVIFILFVIIVTIAACAKLSPLVYHTTNTVRKQILEAEFKSDRGKLTFDNIKSVHELWAFAEEALTKQLYWRSFHPKLVKLPKDTLGGLLFSNKLIGVPTIRQVTVLNGTCSVYAKLRKSFPVCYGSYSSSSASAKTIPGATTEVNAYRHQRYRGLKGTTYSGKVATYDGAGFFLQLGRTQTETLQKLRVLKTGNWLTKATRAVFLDFTLYNPNVDLFCIVKLVFELPPTGGVLPTANIRTFNCCYTYKNTMARVGEGCQIVYFGFIIYFLTKKIRDIMYFKAQIATSFRLYFDMLIIIAALIHLLAALAERLECNSFISAYQKNMKAYYPVHKLSRLDLISTNASGLAIFLIYIKLFKYLSLTTVVTQMANALKKCAKDLFAFSLMFLFVFLAFAEFGYVAFGTQVTDFSTLGTAMFTLFRTILGDFEYKEIEKVHRDLAPVFFVVFIFLVFFVLVNMFLAIINDTYTDVKTEMAIAPDQLQMGDFWKQGFHNFLTDCGCAACLPKSISHQKKYNPTAEEIRNTLKRCGFSDLDIDMFMARYNIDPQAQTKVKDISKIIDSLRLPPTEVAGRVQQGGPMVSSRIEMSAPTKGGQPLMAMDEFAAQQSRLDRVEHIMATIAEKLERLLKKINTLDNIRRY